MNENIVKLIDAIEHLHHYHSGANTYFEQKEHLIFQLLFNEIIKYTPQELEDGDSPANELAYKRTKGRLYPAILSINNKFLFSAIIKTGAFKDKFPEIICDIISSNKKPSNSFYDFLFQIQKDFDVGQKNIAFNIFDNFIKYYSSLEKDEQKTISHQIVQHYIQQPSLFINYLFENPLKVNHDLTKLFLEQYKINKIDINHLFPLDKFLSFKNGTFSITPLVITNVFLKYGFEFNENKFNYNGKNLFLSIVETRDEPTIRTIIPYLKSISPKDDGITIPIQTKIIEQLKDIDSELYSFVNTYYMKLLLDKKITNTSTHHNKNKI